MARLGMGIKSPLNQKSSSGLVAMHGIQPDMQGGLPPPNRHSWPISAHGGSKEKEIPADVQPPGLTSRDVPTDATDGCTSSVTVDGCGFSKRRAEQQVYAPTPIARGGGSTASPYLFEPIPGLAPPIGHPRSPYTSDRISQYIAGLPAEFEPPGEQSFASTAANPADSDNDQSNDTLPVFESESPYTRSPLKRSPGSVFYYTCMEEGRGSVLKFPCNVFHPV
ncbi:uncharacterized protein LOC135345633 [Halichondria panicea]|uniref:uncharacterized protein LOC135345633 n=1 Tax=Halichondria panicea TaxID=6063 RepID=UPI00312B8863